MEVKNNSFDALLLRLKWPVHYGFRGSNNGSLEVVEYIRGQECGDEYGLYPIGVVKDGFIAEGVVRNKARDVGI